jgi:hypothetical protein
MKLQRDFQLKIQLRFYTGSLCELLPKLMVNGYVSKVKFLENMSLHKKKLNVYIYIKLNVCLYILYANLQFYSDLDEILYT